MKCCFFVVLLQTIPNKYIKIYMYIWHSEPSHLQRLFSCLEKINNWQTRNEIPFRKHLRNVFENSRNNTFLSIFLYVHSNNFLVLFDNWPSPFCSFAFLLKYFYDIYANPFLIPEFGIANNYPVYQTKLWA